MPVSCDDNECDDDNECTRESCVDGDCTYVTIDAGELCGGGVCNGISDSPACVRCLDDASELEPDSGCNAARPMCDLSDTPRCVACRSNADCDDDNDCTTDICDAGTCTFEEDAVGASCAGGVCGGEPGDIACERCIDDASGNDRDTGCPSGSPRCEDLDGLSCVGCDEDLDCDDSNDCTTDTCNGSAQCIVGTAPEATSCGGGVCNGKVGAEECVACVDDANGGDQDGGCPQAQPVCDTAGENACRICVDDAAGASTDSGCTTSLPVCDTTSGYSCVVCVDDKAPGNQDSGCSVTAPVCVDGSCVECDGDADCGEGTSYCSPAGICVECLNQGHCDDEVSCTDDACNAGVCSNMANDGNCPDSGDSCRPNICHATNGCQQVTLTPTDIELVGDGGFENGDAEWVEMTNSEYSLIGEPVSDLTAYGGTRVAWLCGANTEVSELYQEITIPSGTIEFTVSGYYRIDFQNEYVSSAQNDPSDYFVGTLQDQTGSTLGGSSELFLSLDGTTQSTMWVPFRRTYTNVATFLPGTAIRLDFYCENDNQPGDVAFFFDDVSVSASVCQ